MSACAAERGADTTTRPGRVVVVVLCGASDRPIASLGDRTPLEAAPTPSLDALAARGSCACVDVISPEIPAESDSGTMSVLGYDPREHYTGRGPLEALGMGFWDADGSSVAFRVNFASWDRATGRLDRRTARDLSDDELAALVEEIRAGVRLPAGVTASLTGFGRHRGILSLTSRTARLSGRVTNTDPGFDAHGPFGVPVAGPAKAPRPCAPLDDDGVAAETARLVNLFVEASAEILEHSEVNRSRRARGLLPANLLLVRDAGDALPSLGSFRERTGRTLSMYGHIPAERALAELVGATFARAGTYADLVERLLADPADVVLVRVKGTDEPGHDGRAADKVAALAAIDAELIGPLVEALGADGTLVVTCAHATPCELGIHSADRVPTAVAGPGIEPDAVQVFSERACAGGGLRVDHASALLDAVFRCSAVPR